MPFNKLFFQIPDFLRILFFKKLTHKEGDEDDENHFRNLHSRLDIQFDRHGAETGQLTQSDGQWKRVSLLRRDILLQ